jgi:hypothetical protein
MRIQRPKNIRIRNTRTHAIATLCIWHRPANPPHKLATPALVHIGAKRLPPLACIVRIQFFTLIYTRMHFIVVNVNLAIIWFLRLVLFVRLSKENIIVRVPYNSLPYIQYAGTVLHLYRWSGQKTGGMFLVGRFLEL